MIFDDENILDKDNKTDNIRENGNEDVLNADYDRVSGSGMMPNIDDFLGTDYHDTMSESIYDEGIGEAVGDPHFSDEAIPDENFDSQFSEEPDYGEPDPLEEPEPVRISFKSIMDGSYIRSESFTSKFPYVMFVIFLFILYIGNRNVAESRIKSQLSLEREVRELRAESITIAAQLMSISKETEVAKRVEDKKLGIHVLKCPPMYFVMDKYERADSLKTDDYKSKSRQYYNDFNSFEDDFKKND